SQLLWHQDTFAYADSFDEAAGRYRGLRAGQVVTLTRASLSGLVVRPERASLQIQSETTSSTERTGSGASTTQPPVTPVGGAGTAVVSAPRVTRYHGSAALDPARVGRDAARIAEELISHLNG